MKLVIEDDSAGLLLRDFLRRRLGFSSSVVTALKKAPGGLTVNGSGVTVRYALAKGDVLVLKTEDAESAEGIVPSALFTDIIYEDDDLVAVNKAHGVPTHPSHGHYADTVANALAYYYREKGVPFVFRAINRLDRATGGIVLVAKNKLSASRLSEQMKSGGIKKTYRALLHGCPDPCRGVIERNIRRAADSIITRCDCDAGEGREAVTVYETERLLTAPDGECVSLVRFEPQTGRTHQLRVHSAYMNTPILGDGLYGDEYAKTYDTLMLYAVRLSFSHPVTGRRVVLEVSPNFEMSNETAGSK